ncbi:hypothetical protein HY442_01055 [Candidatus Parcubacteria bacterium]|nr:hypothetical protein [Candidatus Parcubacteria bacterium]MBI4385582.1 hypothetical protein [Candidatus Parcubacteria bacterium]
MERTAQEIAEFGAGIDRIFAAATAEMFAPGLIGTLFAIPVVAGGIALIVVQFFF